MLAFNVAQVASLYAELPAIIVPKVCNSVETHSQVLIDSMVAIARRTGIATRLREVGIGAGAPDQLADEATLQTRLLANNPREVTREAACSISAAAL